MKHVRDTMRDVTVDAFQYPQPRVYAMKHSALAYCFVWHVIFQYPQPRVYAMKRHWLRTGWRRECLSVPSTSGLRDETVKERVEV